MSAEALHVAAILSPFLSLPVVAWLGRDGRRSWLLAALPAALTVHFLSAFRSLATTGPVTVGVGWIPALGLSLSFHLDGLGLLFATLITGIGTLIVLYAGEYLGRHPDAGRFHLALFAFMGAMLGLVLSDNLLALFIFWELTGLTSYFLIGFEHERPEARRAALQALIVTGAGGLALLAAGILLLQTGGSASLSTLRAADLALRDHALYPPIVVLVLLAAFTKSAQFPFHFWLPNAMEAPTPVSAYLHSATMVKGGIYLLARMTPLLGGSDLWTGALVFVGGLTMVGAAYRSMLETDLKRILAYATVGALGVMTFLLGIGTREAIVAGLTYLLAHACYKGALFLVAGAVQHETGTRDVTALGGLRHSMPLTAGVAMLAAGSMSGVFLFFGYVAKELLYESLQHATPLGVMPILPLAAAFVASIFLGVAAFTAGLGPFIGPRTHRDRIHEPPALLWRPPAVLAGTGLVLGLVPGLVDAPLALAAGSIAGEAVPVALHVWAGFNATLVLGMLTLLGSVGIFVSRAFLRRHASPLAFRTERLYTQTLAALDAVSRMVGPALQSASLRSYVLTIVVTVVALVGTALALGRILPESNRWTPVAPHEVAIAALIVAAAVSAAFARSNMAAVLSLGTVGYSVALIYVLYGAPDLAMTQFAVETLTVVIFVLVFYQLRGFGDLSPIAVRVRDATIALAAGTVIGLLVLFIGTSGTVSRLAAYYADAGPRLAHGHNIVNVMLVDFRGFDTLGEITVLVTVAVGVRALLRIGKERHP